MIKKQYYLEGNSQPYDNPEDAKKSWDIHKWFILRKNPKAKMKIIEVTTEEKEYTTP